MQQPLIAYQSESWLPVWVCTTCRLCFTRGYLASLHLRLIHKPRAEVVTLRIVGWRTEEILERMVN